jgi:Protein of unknown function (DUF3788)
MATSVFADKASKPEDAQLAKALGRASKRWTELKSLVASRHGPIDEEWTFSGQKYGWSLRLKRKKRALIYMTPCKGCFRVAFAFGEKAVQAAHQSDLPASVLKLIDDAPKHPEGRGVRVEIRSLEDVHIAGKLAEIKMAN